MKIAPFPVDEDKRLQVLREYKILDTLPERDFDDLTQIASQICSTPIALISLVDKDRQWFKSKVGLDALETHRDVAFCSHAILQKDVFVVSDSLNDERFYDNPLVVGDPRVRFYAGAPLRTSLGYQVGTLCVIDYIPRTLNASQLRSLQALARQVVNQFELRASKERAEIVAKTKASFLATMSHEIRTPMNGVLSCASLLADTLHEPEELRLVQTIQSCGDSLLAIINDILDFSKIESGKVNLEDQPFSVAESVNEVLELFQAQADEKRIKISYSIEKNTPLFVNGDVTRFRQILTNLISNAVKFTNSSVEVKISAKPLENKNSQLLVRVIDDGDGISLQNQKKLFQNFNQVDASTTRKFGGTGLGLAICKGLVEAMGGEILVSSEVGRGATFSFTITLKQVEKWRPTKKMSLPKEHFEMGKHHPLRILVAEDNRINQMVAKKILAKLGYAADIVSDGEEVIDAIEKKRYDVIFMDQHMPEMDGVEATKLIINKFREDRPQIFALTASVMKEDRERCREAGMDGFLAKPLNINELINALISVNTKISRVKDKKIV